MGNISTTIYGINVISATVYQTVMSYSRLYVFYKLSSLNAALVCTLYLSDPAFCASHTRP